MRHTRWLWVLMSDDGRVLAQSLGVAAAFFTREEADRWAYNNCSFRPRVVKVLL